MGKKVSERKDLSITINRFNLNWIVFLFQWLKNLASKYVLTPKDVMGFAYVKEFHEMREHSLKL